MTTSLTITTVGPLTSTLSTADDAAAVNVLLNFAHATGADPGASNQSKLDHVAAQLAEYMRRIAVERYYQDASADLREEAETNVHW